MLGRINRIKGQEVLIEALASLDPALRNRVEARIVGSGFEDPTAEETLAALVAQAGLSGSVSVEPFSDDPIPSIAGRTWSRCRRAGRSRSAGWPSRRWLTDARRSPPPSGGWARWWSSARPDGCCRPRRGRACGGYRYRRIIDQPASLQGYAAAGRKRYESLFSEENAAAAIADAAREVLATQVAAEGGSRRYRPMDNEFCFGTVIS